MIFDAESPKIMDRVQPDRNFIRKLMFCVHDIDVQERKYIEFKTDKLKPIRFGFKKILEGINPIKIKDEIEFNKLKEVKMELAA